MVITIATLHVMHSPNNQYPTHLLKPFANDLDQGRPWPLANGYVRPYKLADGADEPSDHYHACVGIRQLSSIQVVSFLHDIFVQQYT